MSAEVKPGYNMTEVGVIPEDWDFSPLVSLASIVTGSTPPTSDPKNYGDDFLFVGPGDLSSTKYIFQSSKRLSKKGWSLTRQLPAGSILFTCIGSTIGKVGLAAEQLATNQQINSLIPTPENSSEFIYYALCHASNRIRGYASEQAVPLINKTEFSSVLIAHPARYEQEKISSTLSDADALINWLDQLIAKKRDIKQAAMQLLLTGQKRLPGFSGDWYVKPMSALGNTYGGLAGKTKNDFGHGDARYIPFMNVMTDTVIDSGWLEPVDVAPDEAQNLAKKGDLFFNGSSETPEEVGFCSVLLEEIPNLYLNSFCFGFRFNATAKVDGLFFAYWFRGKAGRAAMSVLAQGATRYNVAKSAFMQLEIPQPSEAEQTAIATVLSDMDAELAALEARRDKVSQLKQGMMQELLTGRIRLLEGF
ncbi:restriction endonuclease subunit S [Geopseudomonas aromaticivorans]